MKFTDSFLIYSIKDAKFSNSREILVDSVGVKALDDYTLEIKLETFIPYFGRLLAFR